MLCHTLRWTRQLQAVHVVLPRWGHHLPGRWQHSECKRMQLLTAKYTCLIRPPHDATTDNAKHTHIYISEHTSTCTALGDRRAFHSLLMTPMCMAARLIPSHHHTRRGVTTAFGSMQQMLTEMQGEPAGARPLDKPSSNSKKPQATDHQN